MRNLAREGGLLWIVLAVIPGALLVRMIGNAINLEDGTIVML